MPRSVEGRREEGFTLIELMMVVLIIAILLAIAIPTFLGARERANNRAVQSNLRNAMTVEFVYFADNTQRFTAVDAELTAIDPSLNYKPNLADLTATPRLVFVEVSLPDGTTVVMGAKTASGKCYWIRSVGGTSAPRFAENNCAATAPVVSDPSLVWNDAWST